MKITIRKCLTAFNEIQKTKERKDGEKTIEALFIPHDKSKAGYWLGRLEEKVTSIRTGLVKQESEVMKQLGTPATEKIGENEVPIPGKFLFEQNKIEAYNQAISDLQDIEEEIEFCPLNFEIFEGVGGPASLWSALAPFLTVPK